MPVPSTSMYAGLTKANLPCRAQKLHCKVDFKLSSRVTNELGNTWTALTLTTASSWRLTFTDGLIMLEELLTAFVEELDEECAYLARNRRCHEMSREIVRNCHEKLLHNSRSDCVFFFGFFFFFWWRKTDEDCELASEVNKRNVNAKCGCGKSSLSLMNFMVQCFGYKSTALGHHAIRLFQSSLEMYFCWNLKQVLSHTLLSGVMSVRCHTSLTLSNELYFETQMVIFQNHILKENRRFERKFFR